MAEDSEFCVLGPLVVRHGEVALPVPRGKQRAVLAGLLLNGNRVVSLDELAETLWGSDPPASARVTLQNYVRRLRKLLRDTGGSRISTLPNGYMFRVEAGELDVARFEAHLRAAKTAARGGDWDASVAWARAGLALWRGAALEDVESESLALREVPRLAEMRLQALEACFDAELHRGRAGEVIAELRHWAGAHPLRERLHAMLMLALYRDGRQAEALAAYQAARRILVGEVGAEPGHQLRNLHRQVLTTDPALQLPDPGDSACSPGGGGLGIRFSLPPDTAAFTGRSAELDAITKAVTGAAGPGDVAGILVIGGMPGAGKTTLAVHAAHVLAAEFPDQRLFIDLHAHTPGCEPARTADVLARLLAATGVDPRFLPADLDGRAELWRDRMAGQRALLVLDNAASSAQVAPLLPGGRCLVLVTSRRHLGDLPGAVTQIPVGVLTPDEAISMFIGLAPRASGDRDGVTEMVALAGFLPLAICLLARVLARHPCWTLADLAAETRARLLTLTAEHDSVAAAFGVSYHNLGPGSQRFFRLLGTHPGTATDAWTAAALADVSPDRAAAQLEALHGEGLLTEIGYCRYGMHDLLRRYARDFAAAETAGEGQQALARLLDYYQHTAALARRRLAACTVPGPMPSAPAGIEVPVLDDARRALDWVRAERASLRACLDLATGTGQHARIVALTTGTAVVLTLDGPWAEGIGRHDTAVAAARHLGDRLGEANALIDLGDLRRRTGDFPGAAREWEEALGIYQDLGDRVGQANALFHLGFVRDLMGEDRREAAGVLDEALGIYRDLGDRLGEAQTLWCLSCSRLAAGGSYLEAAGVLEQVLGIWRDLGHRLGEADVLRSLGHARCQVGDYTGGAVVLEHALGIARDLGSRLGQAHALFLLGTVRSLTGDYPGAGGCLEEALGIWRDLGDRLGVATTTSALGYVRQLTGDYVGAARLFEQASAMHLDIGGRLCRAHALRDLGTMRTLTGDLLGAAGALKQAVAIYRGIGDRPEQARALRDLGTALSLTGDHLGAARVLREALSIHRHQGDPGGRAATLNAQGVLHRLTGNPDRGQVCHQQSLDLARAIGSPRDEARALAGLGQCAITTGRTARARILLRQAHQIFQRIGAAETGDTLTELDALTIPRPAG